MLKKHGQGIKSFFNLKIKSDDFDLLRRTPEYHDFVDRINQAWRVYAPFCGDNIKHFQHIASQEFDSALWQLFLGEYFIKSGFQLICPKNDEPDLCIYVGKKKCWIEARCVYGGTGINAVQAPQRQFFQRSKKSINRIKLRLTQAFQDKIKYLKNSKISKNDFYLIAINAGAVPTARLTVDQTFMAEVLFGKHGMQPEFDVCEGRVCMKNILDVSDVPKETSSGSTVGIKIGYFNNNLYQGVSGVIYSTTRPFDFSANTLIGFELYPNPYAKNVLPNNFCNQLQPRRVPNRNYVHVK